MGATNNADQQNQAAQQQIAAQKQAALASLAQYLGGHPNPAGQQMAPQAPQQFSGVQGNGVGPVPNQDPQHQMLMRALQLRMQQQAQSPSGAIPPQMAPGQGPQPPGPPAPGPGLPPGGPQPGILGLLH